MKKYLKPAVIIMCIVLCIAGSFAIWTARNSTAAVSAHMIEFNRNLERAAGSGHPRTTYEIFVGSFCDSNGDGCGDLNGIRSKLDYISGLGFDAVWLTPVHPSSTYHKYDVDDYYSIDPSFGTVEDYEALLKECHEKGLLVYMDLVLNHTSDDNEWFRSASEYLHELPADWEPDPSYCKFFDYYNFTRQPGDGYVNLEGTNWYYEARFWSEMPDLNLSSVQVREEIRNIMAYWLEKGVDGFRLDAITSYYQDDKAANVDFLRFLTETGRSISRDCSFAGEAWTDGNTIAELYSSGIDSLFDFPFAGRDGVIARVLNGRCSTRDYADEMVLAESACKTMNPDYVDAPFYTNHDMDRNADYYPDDNGPITKMAYAMNLFMPGNAFVYYGEEIGMTGSGKDENRRAPMYWSDEPGDPDMCAGSLDMDELEMRFPPLSAQKNDDLSLYRWFSEVIRVRNAFPAIADGATEVPDILIDDSTAAFFRRSPEYDDVLIVINLSIHTIEKDISLFGKYDSPAAVLNTGEENMIFQNGILKMPAYSIAVFSAE